ncbi:class I SAM-dependent methyltransferase [Kitasatospora viridis]|uniref:Methyltransferase family protein n=1 Tax=Kitasatospora viridis TaxID=281105 RepID=A0A561UAD7_9ACTN|nr:class I SAM-dependent methyltransferase [Kitasatospora viridis]TWF96317.1 methyltransferase family protein [Kitasatospora viridis]
MTIAHQDPRLAGAYERGNAMPAASLAAWTELIADRLGRAERPGESGWLLEVGCGTGVFCAALAELLPGVRVTGVDPSEAMLAEAARHHAHPRVEYLHGLADALPLPDGSCDGALISRVVHHIPDRPAAARELARVLRPGGRVLIRTTVRERLDSPVYTYWPQLLDTDRRRFCAEQELLADFAGAGFVPDGWESFAQPIAGSLAELRERYALRAESKLAALGEAEFAAGLERLAAAAEGEGEGRPVLERYDVLVLRRGGR